MFDDLMKKVKGLKKKGGDGEDDTAEFEMADDALDGLDEDLDEIEDDDFEDDHTGEINPKFDDGNKKKIKLAVMIVALLIGGYIVVDEFVLKNADDMALTPPPIKPRPKRKRKPKTDPDKVAEQNAAMAETKKPENTLETSTDSPKEQVSDNQLDAQVNNPETTIEEKQDSTNEFKNEFKTEETPNTADTSMGNNDNSGELNLDSGSSMESSTSNDSSDSFASEGSGMGSGDGSGSGMGSGDGSGSGMGSGDGSGSGMGSGESSDGGAVGSSGAGSSSQAQDMPIEYVSPPNYEAKGRGLVYNCVKQHWACIDQPNFFQCRGNARWFASKNEATECMTDSVFATADDCNAGQLQKINSNVVPDECFKPE